MNKFTLGQEVRIVNVDAAFESGLRHLVGSKFVVEEIGELGTTRAFIDGFMWQIPPDACEPVGGTSGKPTAFQRVAEMNEAFGNPKGDADNIDWDRIRKQCKNIGDELVELFEALGGTDKSLKAVKAALSKVDFGDNVDAEGVRDALCDIQVFGNGAHHLMGYDADRDMDDVVDALFTRFIKDEADKEATITLHAGKGVTDVYFEGEYPKMIMKSASDQPDAPKGKFLKSASYQTTVFRPAP